MISELNLLTTKIIRCENQKIFTQNKIILYRKTTKILKQSADFCS